MKKYICVICVMVMLLLSSCGNSKAISNPDITRIRSICQLATLECQYNNVAKYYKEKNGFLSASSKAWIEYKGAIRLGIDISQVEMTIKENAITITMPKATVVGVPELIDTSLSADSVIVQEGGFIVKNKITADEKSTAIKQAQDNMMEAVSKDSVLLTKAQDRAKKLIENYIKQLGRVNEVEYTIEWIEKN